MILTMHPGSDGDALSLTWGDPPRHALIDLGRKGDYLAHRADLAALGRVALFVITHIDADHIEGAMPLAAETTPPFKPDDTWFNGHKHLVQARDRLQQKEVLSILQGEKLSRAITRFGWTWNAAFAGGPASTDTARQIDVQGLAVTLLSPSDIELSALEKDWDAALAGVNLRLGDVDEAPVTPQGLERLSPLMVEALAAAPMKPDRATPNGSSIAFLAEHDGRRVLMGADAHSAVIERNLATMGYGPDNRLKVDLFKVNHHGSRANLSPSLLHMLDCTRFAFSTDGTKHHFPDPETVARILMADPGRDKLMYFNFRQKQALAWDQPDLQSRWRYAIVMPPEGSEGLAINV